MRTAQELVDGIENLASLPAVYQQVKAILDDPNSGIGDLAKVLSTDANLTARLLRVVNSVYFGLVSHIDTVTRAVNILGMQQAHDIVLATTVAGIFKGINPSHMNMARFWSNSVMRALIARTSAETAGVTDTERLFVTGLLADIGHLVMYLTEPKLAEQAMLAAKQSGRPLHEVEKATLGCHYAEVGEALVNKWQLGERLAAAVAGQGEPARAAEAFRGDAAILYLARVLTDGIERGQDNDAIIASLNPEIWPLSRLKPAYVATIRMIAEMNHEEVVALFIPDTRSAAKK